MSIPHHPPQHHVTDRFGRPLRDLRVSVTDRCNFRCTYCMPAEVYGERYTFLPRQEILSFEEIDRLVRLFIDLGVRKVRLTGGEPLLRAQLWKLIERLSAIDGLEDLALTTNGYLLEDQAKDLQRAGLRRLTVSLDTLDDETFKRMNGRSYAVDRVLAGIRAAEFTGLTPIKINCVVQRGVNEHAVLDLARRFKGTGHVVRFIEFMDVGTRNRWDLSQVVSAKKILERLSSVYNLEPVAPGYRGEVATRYRYTDGDGEVGLIRSVSAPFCADCTRVRLSSSGQLITCLFATEGTDLKQLLRAGASDAELCDRIATIWSRRVNRYSEERSERPAHAETEPDTSKIEMHEIGG